MSIFELNNSQRYFHIIAIKREIGFFSNSLLTKIGLTVQNVYDSIEGIEIKELSLLTNILYARGETDFSINKDNKPPYKYDLLLVTLKKLNITMFCFPFKYMTKVIINSLINDFNVIAKGNFVKVNLNKLINANEKHTDYFGENINYFFSSVNLTLVEESFLSSVRLEGDKPLDSSLYQSVFEDKLRKGSSKLEKCTLKCDTSISGSIIPKTKSAVHIDNFGNYKFYLHSNSNNVVTIPLLFLDLNRLDCLEESPLNPVVNLTEKEE